MTLRSLQGVVIMSVCVRSQVVPGYARCSRFVAGCNVAVVAEVRAKLLLPIYRGDTPPLTTLKMRVRFAGTIRNMQKQVYEDIC